MSDRMKDRTHEAPKRKENRDGEVSALSSADNGLDERLAQLLGGSTVNATDE